MTKTWREGRDAPIDSCLVHVVDRKFGVSSMMHVASTGVSVRQPTIDKPIEPAL
jgi:hypothetical protein